MEKELPNVPYIMFDKSRYDNEKDFWNAIGQQLKLLTDNEYNALVSYEDCGIYRIEYLHSNLEYGDTRFIGITEDQYEFLLNFMCDEDE